MSGEQNGTGSSGVDSAEFQLATLPPVSKPLRAWDIEEWTCYFRCSHQPSMTPAVWMNHMQVHVETLDQLNPNVHKIPALKRMEYEKYYCLALSNPARYPVAPQRILDISHKLARFVDWTATEDVDEPSCSSEGSIATYAGNSEEAFSDLDVDMDLPGSLSVESDMDIDAPGPSIVDTSCHFVQTFVQDFCSKVTEKATVVEREVGEAVAVKEKISFGMKRPSPSLPAAVFLPPPPKVTVTPPEVPSVKARSSAIDPVIAKTLETQAYMWSQLSLPALNIPLPISPPPTPSPVPPVDLLNVPLPLPSPEKSRLNSAQETLPPGIPIVVQTDQSTNQSSEAKAPPVAASQSRLPKKSTDSFQSPVKISQSTQVQQSSDVLASPAKASQSSPPVKSINEPIRTVSPVLVEMADSTVSSPNELSRDFLSDIRSVLEPLDKSFTDENKVREVTVSKEKEAAKTTVEKKNGVSVPVSVAHNTAVGQKRVSDVRTSSVSPTKTRDVTPSVSTGLARSDVRASVSTPVKATVGRASTADVSPSKTPLFSPLRLANAYNKALKSPLKRTPSPEKKQQKKVEECWSLKPSEGKVRLVSGSSFYVATDILRKLQGDFGPTTRGGGSVRRYGWELIETLLGPQRIRPDVSKGLITMLKNMVPAFDLFDVIIKHMREVFTESTKEQTDRNGFLQYCTTRYGYLRKNLEGIRRPIGTGKRRGRQPRAKEGAGLRSPLNPADCVALGAGPRARPAQTRPNQPSSPQQSPTKAVAEESESSSDSEVDDEEEEDDEEGEESEGENDGDNQRKIAEFLRLVRERNPRVSEEDVRRMMGNEDLKKDVKKITKAEHSLQASRRGHKEFFKPTRDDLGRIRQSNLKETLFLPMSRIREQYSEGKKKNDIGFICHLCTFFCCEELKIQGHVARKHFLKTLSLEDSSEDENSQSNATNSKIEVDNDDDSFPSLSGSESDSESESEWSEENDDDLPGPSK